MDDKKYKIIKPGSGKFPHTLQNVEDPKDELHLCSCGGTKNPEGHCDGSHKKKGLDGCKCYFCKDLDQRKAE